MSQRSWDQFYLRVAKVYAEKSKDPSTKVGAVIVDENNYGVGHGFNGFARGVLDLPDRYENRDLKYKLVVHAELNAILAAGHACRGGSIYTWPLPPCAACASIIVQAGIKRVVAPPPSPEQLERWGDSLVLSKTIFHEASVRFNSIGVEDE